MYGHEISAVKNKTYIVVRLWWAEKKVFFEEGNEQWLYFRDDNKKHGMVCMKYTA